MRVLVTGATGFIGNHLVPILLNQGHNVIALARNEAKASKLPWFRDVEFIAHDIHSLSRKISFKQLGEPDILIHLAWSGLPNYKALFHFEENLPSDYRFIKSLLEKGLRHVVVTGTCFEYGMQSGCLREDMPTCPDNPYALAKDSLRKFLQSLQRHIPFVLQWVRLFYMYGEGQSPNSLLAQLDRAIGQGEKEFNMSGGKQLRDYLHVREVAERIAALANHKEADGIFNCCSGVPISVRELVEGRIREKGANITLNLGHYPYLDYEPMEFWGDAGKLRSVLGSFPARN